MRSCPGEWCNNSGAVVISGKAGLIKLSPRRSAALRYTDGSAPRTVAITAHEGNVERQTPIPAG